MQKDITTDGQLSGGVLPRELFNEWFEEVQNETTVLNRIRTVDMPRPKMTIPKIGVGERLMSKSGERQNNAETDAVSTAGVDMDAVKTDLKWSLPEEAVEDVLADVPDIVLSKMRQQFAVDAEDLGANGTTEAANPSGFEEINEGWFQLAADRNSPVYYHDAAGDGTGTAQVISTEMFDGASRKLDSKYLRTDPAFFVNTKHVQQYFGELASRNDGLGVAVLQGDTDVNPFGYDIIGSPVFPTDRALFTAPENLIWGLHREVTLEVLENSDETFDLDLHGKYKLSARHDYQIEDENGAVLVEGITDPST
jgi:HK97 family phage major capsid protein